MMLDGLVRSGLPGGDLAFNLALATAAFEAVDFGLRCGIITLDTKHLDSLVPVTLALLPRRNLVESELYTETDKVVADFLSELCDWFYVHGVQPSCAPYNVAILFGGKLRNINLLEWAMEGMRRVNVFPGTVSFFCLMTAGGTLSDPNTVMSAWRCLTETL